MRMLRFKIHPKAIAGSGTTSRMCAREVRLVRLVYSNGDLIKKCKIWMRLKELLKFKYPCEKAPNILIALHMVSKENNYERLRQYPTHANTFHKKTPCTGFPSIYAKSAIVWRRHNERTFVFLGFSSNLLFLCNRRMPGTSHGNIIH